MMTGNVGTLGLAVCFAVGVYSASCDVGHARSVEPISIDVQSDHTDISAAKRGGAKAGGAKAGGAKAGGAKRANTGARNVKANTNVNRNVKANTNVNRNVNRTNVNRTNVNVNRNVVVRPVRGWVARPYYGTIVGGVALGTMIAVATAGTTPAAPAANMCWFWADQAQVNGYWDYCTPPL